MITISYQRNYRTTSPHQQRKLVLHSKPDSDHQGALVSRCIWKSHLRCMRNNGSVSGRKHSEKGIRAPGVWGNVGFEIYSSNKLIEKKMNWKIQIGKNIYWCGGNVTLFLMWLCLPDCSHISSNLIYHCCQERKPVEPVIWCFLSNLFSRRLHISGTLLAYYYQEQCSLSLNLPIDPGNLHWGGMKGSDPFRNSTSWLVQWQPSMKESVSGSGGLWQIRVRWSLLITMSLPITSAGFRPVSLKCAPWVLEHYWIFFPRQVVNCTLLWLWV